MRGEVLRIEGRRVAIQSDRSGALPGFRDRGAAVEEHAQRGGTILLLDEHLREAAVPTVGGRETREQIAELLLGLTQPTGLQALQTGRERDLVIEVGRTCSHCALVCAGRD